MNPLDDRLVRTYQEDRLRAAVRPSPRPRSARGAAPLLNRLSTRFAVLRPAAAR